MINKLQLLAECSNDKTDDNFPLTRIDVVRALIQTSFKDELRFQVRIDLDLHETLISSSCQQIILF